MTTNWQQPQAPPPNPPNGGSGNNGKGKRFAIVATLLVVIAGLGAAAGLVMVNRDSDDAGTSAEYVVMQTDSTTPVFEPRDAEGNDPFFPLAMAMTSFQEEVQAEMDEQYEQAVVNAEPGETVVRQVFDVAALDEAVKTGLYGGTEENTCDPERLISFLYANPDLLEAWASVQGIEVVDVADYIRSLEPRVLAEPLAVLNHGYDFASGAAYEIDAVLDAGTAVLVDADGNVRTRCYCGNPIKPKPPESMPPRCLVYGTQVFIEPGGGNKRNGVPRDVLLTNRETTLGNGAHWVEVKWGTGDDERGWVRADNLRKHYCPTPTSDRYCPGPGAVDVWHTPNTTNKVGQVTGVVRTHDNNLDIFAPINPVGGIGSEIIVNDFMLIRFTEASPSLQNSAWVQLSDLNQDSSECQRIRQCIDTEGFVWERAGGAVIPGAEGVIWVEFTGHFVDNPITHAEVRLNNGSGDYAWIGQFYTPLADSECDRTPVYDCVGSALVYETSTQELPDHLGHLFNADVMIVGGPQDGRVQIQFAAGGPVGWVDQAAFFDGHNHCEPDLWCYTTSSPAWTEFATNGVSTPAIVMPAMLEVHGQFVHDDATATDYTFIGIGGTDYWIDEAALIPLPLERCDEGDVDCPRVPYLSPVDEFVPTLRRIETLDDATTMRGEPMDANDIDEGYPLITECCVGALYNSTNVADVAAVATPVEVIVVDSMDVGGVIWYLTIDGYWFTAADIRLPSDCDRGECPEPWEDIGIDNDKIERLLDAGLSETLILQGPLDDRPDRPERPERPVNADCCVDALFVSIDGLQLDTFGQSLLVEVAAGPFGDSPAWYQTTEDSWFPETAVVDPSNCEQIECPTPGGDNGIDDDRRDDLEELLQVELALTLFVPGDSAECCIQFDLWDAPDGLIVDGLDGPTPAVVISVSDDGQWYEVFVDGGVYWVRADQFVDISECVPDTNDCPRTSIIDFNDNKQQICCAQFELDGAIVFEAVTLTGETRFADGGGIEFNTNDHGWVHEDQFVGAGRCDTDDEATCPTFAVTDVNDLSRCCVDFGNAEFDIVELTGETRDAGGGVLEYNTVDHGWILETQFASAGRCDPTPPCDGQIMDSGFCCERPSTVIQNQCQPPCQDGQPRNADGTCPPPPVRPCPEGQVRDDNGDCYTPEISCPTGQVFDDAGNCVTPPCQNSDDDSICDVDDNCDFNANEDQADADNDGIGDKCDECSNVDGDQFCDFQDNCPTVPNDDQTDSDRDGEGDVCDTTCSDVDEDDVCDIDDNCVDIFNPNQENTYGDEALGDACEDRCPTTSSVGNGDRDGDGICDVDDNCPGEPNPGQRDTYGEKGVGDACEERCPSPAGAVNGDRDGDGVCDLDDNCISVANPGQADPDGDFIGSACDNCPDFYNTGQIDSDDDGYGNGCDFCPDPQRPWDASNDYNPDQGFTYDLDGDGVNESCYYLG